MDGTIALGSNMVRIEGDSAFFSFLPAHWRKSVSAVSGTAPNAILHIERADMTQDRRLSDGWSTDTSDGMPTLICCDQGKPLFGLRYGTIGNDIHVLIGDADGRAERIAIQYGLMLALRTRCIGLHGVTLLCGSEIIILSAPSGTGKTTLAHLLEKHCNAIMVNGDFALLSPTPDGVIFEPTPFCGTSGRCLNHRLRVNRVVFLGQSPVNQWHALTAREALVLFMNNTFIPPSDTTAQHNVNENILKCMAGVKVNRFVFAPTSEAAEMFYNQLQS